MVSDTLVDIIALQRELTTVRQRCHGWRGQATMLHDRQAEHRNNQERSAHEIDVLEKAQQVLQLLETTWRGKYQEALAALGSQGLNAVFTNDTYEVLLESTVKRGVTNLDIILVKNGERVRLKGGSGGSVVQVLSYLLRHIMTISHRPELRKLKALDEPFSMLNRAQRPALGELVKDITQRLDFQLIFSSDEDELVDVADVVIQVHPGGRVECVKTKEEDRS
ncbi:hypothetical protein LCGC14_2337000 [marine sediment metagenome]|uniref:RecF/RecN/SMC N-terminal domain-containing protein n=1 Tax=marine sediment metagenome TaxID=412755 RepID=A0A0F9D0Q1_9ZZZZ